MQSTGFAAASIQASPAYRTCKIMDGPVSTAAKCHGVAAGAPQRGRPSRKEFITVGVDLAKNYFQVHALESEDGGAATRKLSRQAMRKFFSETKPILVE
jgi:transposase